MIQKVLIFNNCKEVKIYRDYCETMSNEDVVNLVFAHQHSNILSSIVYKQYGNLYVALVIENENHMYALSVVNLLMADLNKSFVNLTDLHFDYHFSTIYSCLDNIIAGGYVVNTGAE